jgi:hypothetical protein
MVDLTFEISCAQIKISEESREDDVWQDLFLKLVEGIFSTFNQQMMQIEEEIRKMDAQRMLPGWNYCTFFMIKVKTSVLLNECFPGSPVQL